ncbi:ubiquitin-like domain-containing protein [Streptomyces sp. CRN 30]|uniref:ubiquitin-like domain-containing protein n=1 Tax=Streptomyces sp. CRN 30 TaxID=3075613 RepID=UPI002A82F635|nr:ubiquitin-like domain-containing protein [Streptomyces sp. CRN 30]
MSNAHPSQYSPYETYGPGQAYPASPAPYPDPRQRPRHGGTDPYRAHPPVHAAVHAAGHTSLDPSEDLAYDALPYTAYARDTYRPAYEDRDALPMDDPPEDGPADDEPEVALPRQADGGRAGARRAARRRRTPERPAPLRRLVPQALVVAFLAGGTTAFVAQDKAIELSVDGRPRTLHTFADDVTELLAREGVAVGAHDVVAPAPGVPLATGDEVAVEYGRPVRLTLDGQRRRLWTTARTVEGALEELGVRSEGAYVSAERTRRIGRAGLALDVRTERTVTVMADGRARRIRTNAATVGEAVDQAGITLEGQDTTSVPRESFPRDGQTITVLRIRGTKEFREEPIPFDVERRDDPALFQGTEVVEQAGEQGVRRVAYALRTVNGVKQKPRRLYAEMIRAPRTQVVKVGTKPMPASVQGTDHLDWDGLAHCESGGRPDAVDSSGTYGGLYQFDRRTWQSIGGQGRPQDAPVAEQTYRAKKLYVQRGASPWPHCGSELHE